MKDNPPTPPPKTNTRPSIHLNLEDWMPYLADSEAPEAEKIKLIETVWDIAMGFVDLGWELDIAEENSGQSFDLTAVLHAAVLYSEQCEDTETEAL